MKRAVSSTIKNTLDPLLIYQNGEVYIKKIDIPKASELVMSEFTGVYCSTAPLKDGILRFTIKSISITNKKFLEAVVIK